MAVTQERTPSRRGISLPAPPTGLLLQATPEPSAGFVDVLANTVYGTSGVRYRTFDLEHAFDRLEGHASFIELRESGDTLGTYLLVSREARAPGGPLTAIYRTCLAVRPSAGGRGLGRVLVDAARRAWLEEGTGRRVLYGTIDPTNTRSLALAEKAGYRCLATLEAVTFTRLLPWRSESVGPLADDERPALLDALEADFGDRTLFDAPESVRADEVMVYREDGEVVAAVQLVPKQVQLVSLGGRVGELAVQVLRWIPGLRRFVRPTTILQACALWAEDGFREKVVPLLEHAMRAHRSSSLVLLLDPREPLHAWLRRAMRLGWLHFWLPRTETVQIMAGFGDLSDEEIETLVRRPFWVSALDLE